MSGRRFRRRRHSDPRAFIHHLDLRNARADYQARKRHTFALFEVKAGHHLLDVGCGTGEDVRALAHLVGRTGRVVGVDSSATLIAEACKRAAGLHLPVEYYVGDVQRLDFADHTFDGCRAERVFIHLDNPRQALAEMTRVARSGTRIVVLDPDLETQVIAAEDRTVTRKILNFFCDRFRNGWMGRYLAGLFQGAQLADIAVFADTALLTDYAEAEQMLRLQDMAERAQEAGVVSVAEAATWLGQLETASQAGRFFLAFTVFCVSGRKP
ncbi:MAG: methyltransferase domain-containing protein [Deltaproteobacteria bacterium]|nr:methyltransferase domain-containing protein [Deltaproteobacteria bacterium]